MREAADAVVLGAGPAGLGAALALARAGADVALLDAAPVPGGLCVTRRRRGVAYDLGGHALFVRDAPRLAWLRELLGADLIRVPRPVASVRDGRVVPGRYLDLATGVAPRADALPGQAADAYLAAMPGVDPEVARRYLEKVDGLPLAAIPAQRVERLLVGQAAPDGFWFAREGIGQLMDRMAEAVADAGGRVRLGTAVTAIDVGGGRATGVRTSDGPLSTPRVVVALPAGLASALAVPHGPAPAIRMRAVCIVVLRVPERLGPEPWIQVDDPRTPFARVFEPANWSPTLAPAPGSAVGCECYCEATADDPVWARSDEELAAACAAALHDPLGLLGDPARASLVEVMRIPRAYPTVALDEMAAAQAPAAWLEGLAGLELAQGGAVIEAIEAGEAAAARAAA